MRRVESTKLITLKCCLVAVGLSLVWNCANWAAPPASDIYGDPLPPGVIARMGTLRMTVDGAIESVSFSPDGKMLVSGGGRDNSVRLWDVATGKEIRRMRGHTGAVQCVAYSADGAFIATGSLDNTARLWQAASGKPVRTIETNYSKGVRSIVFSPDGAMFATSGSRGDDAKSSLWLAATGEQVREFDANCVAFSPNGKTIALRVRETGSIALWNLMTDKLLSRFAEETSQTSALAFSPDGKTLGEVRDEKFPRLWDVATGRLLCELKGKKPRSPCYSIAFSPDGRSLVMGSRNGGTTLWDLSKREVVRRFYGGHHRIKSVTFSSDGKTLAGASGARIYLWDLSTGKDIRPVSAPLGPALYVAYSPDGKTLASSHERDPHIYLWDTATGKIQQRFTGRLRGNLRVAFSPDGKWLAHDGIDRTKTIRNLETGEAIHGFSSLGGRALAWSPDGRLLATDAMVEPQDLSRVALRLWDFNEQKVLHEFRIPGVEAVWCVAFSPDGKLMAAGASGPVPGNWELAKRLRIWDVQTGRLRMAVDGPRREIMIYSVAFSPDGKLLATTNGMHGQSLWEVATGKRIRPPKERWDELTGAHVRFLPDGRTMATGGSSKIACFWDVATGKEIGRYRSFCRCAAGIGNMESIAISTDGKTIATGELNILIRDVGHYLKRRPADEADLEDEDLVRLWRDLASADAPAAHRAVWTLIGAPEKSVSFLNNHLRPAPVLKVDAKRIAHLIEQLDSDQFSIREQATVELEKFARVTESSLRKALSESESDETTARLTRILTKLESASLSSDELQIWRAIQVLENIATPDAERVLQRLAMGSPQAPETVEAKASLMRAFK